MSLLICLSTFTTEHCLMTHLQIPAQDQGPWTYTTLRDTKTTGYDHGVGPPKNDTELNPGLPAFMTANDLTAVRLHRSLSTEIQSVGSPSSI